MVLQNTYFTLIGTRRNTHAFTDVQNNYTLKTDSQDKHEY